MTTVYHTPITNGASNDASTVNTPLGELDAELVAQDARLDTIEATIGGGSISPSSNVTWTGTHEFDAQVDFDADVDINSTSFFGDTATFDGSVVANGTVNIGGTTSITDDLTVTGNTHTSGNATAGTLIVTGSSSFQGIMNLHNIIRMHGQSIWLLDNAGVVLSGTGAVSLTSGNVNLTNGDVFLSNGDVDLVSGDINFEGSASDQQINWQGELYARYDVALEQLIFEHSDGTDILTIDRANKAVTFLGSAAGGESSVTIPDGELITFEDDAGADAAQIQYNSGTNALYVTGVDSGTNILTVRTDQDRVDVAELVSTGNATISGNLTLSGTMVSGNLTIPASASAQWIRIGQFELEYDPTPSTVVFRDFTPTDIDYLTIDFDNGRIDAGVDLRITDGQKLEVLETSIPIETSVDGNTRFFLIQTTSANILQLDSDNYGNDTAGPLLRIGRNSSSGTEGGAPAAIQLIAADDDDNYIYPDNSGVLRIHTAAPTGDSGSPTVNITAGTVVGTQTSFAASKHIADTLPSLDDAIARVRNAASALRSFAYRSGAYNGEQFPNGIVTDLAPHYGMDRDADHPQGKSLNVITLHGDTIAVLNYLLDKLENM